MPGCKNCRVRIVDRPEREVIGDYFNIDNDTKEKVNALCDVCYNEKRIEELNKRVIELESLHMKEDETEVNESEIEEYKYDESKVKSTNTERE